MEIKKIKPITICIDFDGTCVTHEFPLIGKDIGAEPVLKELVENGHKLILFTMRDYLEIEHIEFNFIQTFQERERESKLSKILSDEFEDLFKI